MMTWRGFLNRISVENCRNGAQDGEEEHRIYNFVSLSHGFGVRTPFLTSRFFYGSMESRDSQTGQSIPLPRMSLEELAHM
ncbi:MAG: hypothetical protein CMJ89_17510 [Planctomycetes bacterium]|nr:hypothetical protein [Planctomycetota bacterium]